jgi:hypothetical protein
MADVALSRLKAEGKFYDPGEEVPDLEDADALKERGVIGSSADFDAQEKERKDAEKAADEAQQEADEKQAEADQLRLVAQGILNPQYSVTDEEAKALNKKDDEEEPAPEATSTKATAAKASSDK